MVPRINSLPSFVCACVAVNRQKQDVDEVAAQGQAGGRPTLLSCDGRLNRRTGVRERTTELFCLRRTVWSQFFHTISNIHLDSIYVYPQPYTLHDDRAAFEKYALKKCSWAYEQRQNQVQFEGHVTSFMWTRRFKTQDGKTLKHFKVANQNLTSYRCGAARSRTIAGTCKNIHYNCITGLNPRVLLASQNTFSGLLCYAVR